MNILHLVYEDILAPTGGLGVHCYGLSKAIGESGHYNLMLTISQDWNRGEIIHHSKNVDIVKIKHLSPQRISSAMEFQHILEYDYLVNAFQIILKNKISFDVIHLHDSHLWVVATALRSCFNIPIVMTTHLSPLLHGLQFLDTEIDDYKCVLEGNALCGADHILSISQDYKHGIEEVLGIRSDIPIIGNGVDYEELEAVPYDTSITKVLKFNNSNPTIGLVGRMTKQKGIVEFLEAAKRLPNVNFVLICHLARSAARQYPLCKEVDAASETVDNFQWINEISWPDKYKLMKVLDIGCMPSVFEPFGIAALEWMALGVPLIVTRTGGLQEFCSERNADMIVPGDTDSLVASITNFKKDDEKISNALSTAKQYSWENVAEKTVKEYEEVLQKCKKTYE